MKCASMTQIKFTMLCLNEKKSYHQQYQKKNDATQYTARYGTYRIQVF